MAEARRNLAAPVEIRHNVTHAGNAGSSCSGHAQWRRAGRLVKRGCTVVIRGWASSLRGIQRRKE